MNEAKSYKQDNYINVLQTKLYLTNYNTQGSTLLYFQNSTNSVQSARRVRHCF